LACRSSPTEALAAAGTAGDPWTTVLPGAYGAGTAGKIIGDNLNATVSSRASQTSVDTIDDFLDTEVAAILADTNELQTDWTNGGRLDLLVDAIKAKTDNLPAAPAATGDIPTAAAVADAVWDEDATAHQTQGTFGQAIGDPGVDTDTIFGLLNTNLDATVSSRSSQASVDVIDAIVDNILIDTAEIGAAGAGLTNINLPDQTMNITGNITGNLSGSVGSVTGAVGSVTGAVGSVTGNVGGNVTGSVGSLAAQAKADVNAEVVDALATDTYAEPGQGSPAATASVATKIGYMYKAWRNRSTQTATTYSLYADDATTVDQKATVSDDATTFTRGEVATGP
jgi:hypothetical protein